MFSYPAAVDARTSCGMAFLAGGEFACASRTKTADVFGSGVKAVEVMTKRKVVLARFPFDDLSAGKVRP